MARGGPGSRRPRSPRYGAARRRASGLLAAQEPLEDVRNRRAVALLELAGQITHVRDVVRALAERRVVAVAVQRLAGRPLGVGSALARDVPALPRTGEVPVEDVADVPIRVGELNPGRLLQVVGLGVEDDVLAGACHHRVVAWAV